MICLRCNEENGERARFCQQCGSQLRPTRPASCGHGLPTFLSKGRAQRKSFFSSWRGSSTLLAISSSSVAKMIILIMVGNALSFALGATLLSAIGAFGVSGETREVVNGVKKVFLG